MEEALMFQSTLKNIYNQAATEMLVTKSFDEVISTNESRVTFICDLVDMSVNGGVSNSLFELFKTNYQFIYNYLMGNITKSHLAVPKDIKENLNDINYVPTPEELDKLLDMLRINNTTFKRIYDGNQLYIKIPEDTLHKNIIERLEIRKNNIAHLLGITSRQSALTKLFVELDKQRHPEYYDINGDIIDKEKNGIAIRIVDFYTSNEGIEYLRRLNNSIRRFIAVFGDRNPGSVDETTGGVIPSYMEQFKEEFQDLFGFKFPLLEYNKMFVKNVGFYNQTELSYVSEIILDYDSRKSEKNTHIKSKKFLVHYDAEEHQKQIQIYNELVTKTTDIIKLAAQLPEEQGIKVLVRLGLERHKPLLYQYRNNLSRQVLVNLNIRNTDLINELNSLLNDLREKTKGTTKFPYDTQLLGFIPDIEVTREVDINELLVNTGICETNLLVSIPELMQEYYGHSRRYFIDAIRDSHGNYVRVGNIRQEEEFQYTSATINAQDGYAYERLDELQNLKEMLNSAITKFEQFSNGYIPPNKSKK